jgi:hypothetical protein
VYEALDDYKENGSLRSWCGLRETPATASEIDRINSLIMSVPDIREVFCFSGGDETRGWAAAIASSDRLRWVRLHHPNDPNRWIGIGVQHRYNTGGWSDYIVFRVRVGF